ncbi:MAG: HypC/HybG/HupF family hydrogenase formation chaperone [Bacteriovoracaceae bacterium]|nr:HypC/HybG/HupF family hydrogenase formation chaperone [Bacteriovoracaceae bacterium]
MCLAIPVKVVDIRDDMMAKVEKDGVKLDVATMLVEDLKVGEYVLVHAGFIIERLTLEDAQDKLDLYREFQEKVKGQQ